MTLVKCPDCGNPVSAQAPACPKCGRPLGERPRGGKRGKGRLYEALGTLILVGGMFACMFDGLSGGVAIAVGFLVFLVGRFLP